MQFIDARDLAEWMIRLAESGHTGDLQRHGSCKYADDGHAGRRAKGAGAMPKLIWAQADSCEAQKARPGATCRSGCPGRSARVSAALQLPAAGGRPDLPAAGDTAATPWPGMRTRPADQAWRAGLPPDRERELLAASASFQTLSLKPSAKAPRDSRGAYTFWDDVAGGTGSTQPVVLETTALPIELPT